MTKGSDKTASMRLKDLQLTAELLAEAVEQEDGARERIAKRHGIRKSVITGQIQRMEKSLGVALFTGPQRKTPTAAGRMMARHGPRLIEEIGHFGAMLRDTRDLDVLSLSDSPNSDEKLSEVEHQD